MKERFLRYERYLIPGALILGFITDLITFRLINLGVALTLLLFYLVLAGISIIVINLYDVGFLRTKFMPTLRVLAPLILQYSFGAVLSASVIFYSFSGTLLTSWPFILVLILLFLSNEVFKKYYSNQIFKFSIYFFVIYSYLLLVLPFLFHILGLAVFISSGILSLAVITFFIRWLSKRVVTLKLQSRKVFISIIAVFSVMNIFYFFNVIPPFPLSVREVGIYHFIEKTPEGNYRLLGEERSWRDYLSFYKKFHVNIKNKPAYVFSAIFSPSKLNLQIIHEWEKKDQNDEWQVMSVVSFPIVGGRPEGYRGYSRKMNITPGRWRVNIRTKSGQIISRLYFEVVESEETPNLSYIEI